MRPRLKPALIGLAVLGIFFGGYLFGVTASSLLPGPSRPPIDLREDISAPGPNGNIEAVVLRGSEHEPFNFLGTDEQAYLGLKLPDTTIIVSKDLFEGNGTYETAIHSLKWLDEDRILVERSIQDRKDNLEFNLEEMKWRNVGPFRLERSLGVTTVGP